MSSTCPPHDWSWWQHFVWLGWAMERRYCHKCGSIEQRRQQEDLH